MADVKSLPIAGGLLTTSHEVDLWDPTEVPLRDAIPTSREIDGATPDLGDRAGRQFCDDEYRRQPFPQQAGDVLRSLDPRTIPGSKLPLGVLITASALATLIGSVISLAGPEIQTSFGLSVAGILQLTTLLTAGSLLFALPLGYLADRVSRVRLLRITAVTGVVSNVVMSLAGSTGGFASANLIGAFSSDLSSPVVTPLLADWYPSSFRGRVVSLFSIAGVVAGVISSAAAGILIQTLGWRESVLILSIVSIVIIPLYFLLREPVRGVMDRLESGTSMEEALVAPAPPSFREAVRGTLSIRTILILALAGLVFDIAVTPSSQIAQLVLSQRFLLSPSQRGFLAVLQQSLLLPTLLIGGAYADRLIVRSPRLIVGALAGLSFLSAAVIATMGVAPNLAIYLIPQIIFEILTVAIVPAQVVLLSLVIPARFRATGIGVNGVFAFVATLLALPLEHSFAGNSSQHVLLVFAPVYVVAGFVGLGAIGSVTGDIRAARAAALARTAADATDNDGRVRLLVARDIDVAYDGVQVVRHASLDVHVGEIVALLGTNGAGKSSLMRTLCGLQQADNGAVIFDGREITSAPTDEIARLGLVYLPGGQGVFPEMTVRENLQTAGWMGRDDEARTKQATENVLELFPVLRERLDSRAGVLSGGEQQMLAVSQMLLLQPKLLMIDELSLGLAPAIVDKLLDVVRGLQATGTTILLVEQSLNVALTIASRAIFMDRGRIEFDGPTEDLLARPDLVRAVFMGGATTSGAGRGKRTSAETEETAPALQAEGIDISFGGRLALNNLSLQVKAGEILGIIGPNGAGKTTLFDVLSGYLKPESGTVALAGTDVSKLSPDARARLGLGRAFQSARLFPALSVRETITVAHEKRAQRSAFLAAIWAPPLRRNERELAERVDGLIELLGLGRYADTFVRELSTGTRRAVEIACQMAAEPQVLLLDEPSSGLAQAETEALGPTLTRLVRDTGCGLLVIEHDLPLITAMSDRLIAMELGAVLATGAPAVVMQDPLVVNSYLAASSASLERSGSRIDAITAAVNTAAADLTVTKTDQEH